MRQQPSVVPKRSLRRRGGSQISPSSQSGLFLHDLQGAWTGDGVGGSVMGPPNTGATHRSASRSARMFQANVVPTYDSRTLNAPPAPGTRAACRVRARAWARVAQIEIP